MSIDGVLLALVSKGASRTGISDSNSTKTGSGTTVCGLRNDIFVVEYLGSNVGEGCVVDRKEGCHLD